MSSRRSLRALALTLAVALAPAAGSAQHRVADDADGTPPAAPAAPPRRATPPATRAAAAPAPRPSAPLARAPRHAAPPARTARAPRETPPPPPCLGPAVEIHRINGHGTWTGPLTDCAGHPTTRALAALSMLASPRRLEAMPDLAPVMREIRRIAPAVGWTLAEETAAPRASRTPPPCPPGQEPVAPPAPTATAPRRPTTTPRTRARAGRPATVCRAIVVPRDPHTRDPLVVLDDSVRVLNPRLVTMLAQVTAHFRGHRVEVISGWRPSRNPRAGSRHAHARALDFRLAGVSREALRDFAYSLPNAGVGYYPNSVFVHLDVRDPDEGSARWTDYSARGEAPRYGRWPPRDADVAREMAFITQQVEGALDAARHAEDAQAAAAEGAAAAEDDAREEPMPPPTTTAAPGTDATLRP